MIYQYAQIDKSGVCVGEATSSTPLCQPDMIRFDGTLPIGKKWTSDGWIDGPLPTLPPPEIGPILMDITLKQAELEMKLDAIGTMLVPTLPEV